MTDFIGSRRIQSRHGMVIYEHMYSCGVQSREQLWSGGWTIVPQHLHLLHLLLLLDALHHGLSAVVGAVGHLLCLVLEDEHLEGEDILEHKLLAILDTGEL